MKRLTMMLVLAVVALSLLAAQAFAAGYPAEYTPGTAYIHPYDGNTWAYWEEYDWDGNWDQHDIDLVPNTSWGDPPYPTYEPIPSDYTVYFVGVFAMAPRGQAVSLPSKFEFDFTIGSKHVTAAEARQYYGAPMQIEGWESTTVFSKDIPVPIWVRSWMYPVPVTAGTTYSGTMSYALKAPMTDLMLYDPAQTTPVHSRPYSSSAPYTFDVAP